MISALFYLQYHSLYNRLRARFRRLKQPKYLAGAIVGGIYFYWYFFRLMFTGRGRHGLGIVAATPVDLLLYESLGALALFVIVLLAWVLPHKRAALAFTEAEVAFLFPAPITRRGLIHFKLLRSQAAIFFTTLLLAFITNRFGVGGKMVIHLAGWWLMLSLLNLHFLGSSFALTALMDRGLAHWQRRLAVLAVVLAGFGIVVAWAVRALPPLTADSLTNLETMTDYAQQALVSGPLPYLLYPFRLVVRPYLAVTALDFLIALGPVLLLLVTHYWWVIRADVAFEEGSIEASKKLAEKVAALRAGKLPGGSKNIKSKRAPFQLTPLGPRPVALLWKNLIGAGQAFTMRTWITLATIAVGVSFGLRSANAGSSWLPVVGSIVGMLGVMLLLMGPQIVRQDFRQDLPQADLLKLYPMRGWQVALGEILAPVIILTSVQWLLLLVAAACFGQTDSGLSGVLIVAISVGAAIMLPMFNMISLVIPNAAVLLFPGWFQTGKEAPQGIEATGQRLIFALGQFLALLVALIPAGVVFAGLFFLVQYAAGVVLAVPVASAAATVVLVVEAGLGVMLLGRLFERLDISAEQT